MTESTIKWYEDPLLIAAIQFEQPDDRSYLVPSILDDAKFNAEQMMHIFNKGIIGLYHKDRDEERVRRYLDLCPNRNIIMYTDAHVTSLDTFNQHPDWAQRTISGDPAISYGSEVLLCVNSPWRSYLLDRIREELELPIKGIFLDGPLFTGAGCFCPACRSLFEKRYGHSMEQADRTEIREFKTEHIARMIADVRKVIRESGKDVILYANNHGLSENITGCDIDAIYDHVDFLGTEGGFLFYGDPNTVSLWKGSETARYLESKAYGKPYVIFCAGNHQPWARYMMTPEENELLIAYTVANGANIWYGIHGEISDFDTKSGKAGLNLIRKLAENKEYYKKTKRRSDIAVLWSKQSIHAFPEVVEETDFTVKENLGGIDEFGSFQSEFNGICEILVRNHMQFSIIDEANVCKDDLSTYRIIILPNTICVDDKSAHNLEQYVKNGGILLSTLSTAFCKEDGTRRKESALASVFGMNAINNIINYEAGCGYLSFIDQYSINMTENPTAGFAGKVVKAQYAPNTEVLGWMHDPLPGRYSHFVQSKYPAIVANPYGRGLSVYIAGGLGATYKEYGISDFKTLFINLIHSYINTCLTVEGAYETVEILLREQESRTLVHFVNYTGAMRRPIENIIPCHNMRVSVEIKHPVHRVFSFSSGKELSYTQNENIVSFTVDVDSTYDVAIID